MAKLTPKQREFLTRALNWTYSDGTGPGAIPHDGREIRTAEILHRKGLCTLPAAWTAFTGCRITNAGREALAAPSAGAQGGEL